MLRFLSGLLTTLGSAMLIAALFAGYSHACSPCSCAAIQTCYTAAVPPLCAGACGSTFWCGCTKVDAAENTVACTCTDPGGGGACGCS